MKRGAKIEDVDKLYFLLNFFFSLLKIIQKKNERI